MTNSLLQICQNAANEAGVTVPAAIVGNADPAAARLLQLSRREARSIAERANWVALTVENVFIANGTSDYTLPADFRSIVNDTLWDRSRFWRMRGALSPQQWQMYKSSVIGRASIERRWRIRLPAGDPGGATVKFELDPPITGDTTSNFVYEYVSKNWCASTTLKQATNAQPVAFGSGYALGDTITLSGGTQTIPAVLTVLGITTGGAISTLAGTGAPGSAPVEVTTVGNYTVIPSNPVSQASTSGTGSGATFTMTWGNLTQPDWVADTDIPIIDDDVLELGVIWRLLRRLGLAYDEEKEEYERRLDILLARDGGTATLDLAPVDRFNLIGPYNLPETGFGPVTS